MKMGTFQTQERVKGQIAKRKRQSPGKDCNYPGKSFWGYTFAFCTLRFAFCLFLWGCHSERSEESRSALTLPALKVT
jgi:hypothetical protein